MELGGPPEATGLLLIGKVMQFGGRVQVSPQPYSVVKKGSLEAPRAEMRWQGVYF